MPRKKTDIDYCTNCFEGIIHLRKCGACGHEYKLRIMKEKTMSTETMKPKFIPAISHKEVTRALNFFPSDVSRKD